VRGPRHNETKPTCATGAHIATRRNSSTCGASGAPPLTMSRTRPPSRALTYGGKYES
jgi:hypothetical protein